MAAPINPFDPERDPDRHLIWKMMIVEDSQAFVAGDWGRIAGDFDAENFEGLRANESPNPDDWRIAFPTLDDYRDSWLEASRQFTARRFAGISHLEAVYARTHLNEIEIAGDRALARKKFFGTIQREDGSQLAGSRQTLYRLHRKKSGWKIVGFIGQLPL
jgi:hypothetical protein